MRTVLTCAATVLSLLLVACQKPEQVAAKEPPPVEAVKVEPAKPAATIEDWRAARDKAVTVSEVMEDKGDGITWFWACFKEEGGKCTLKSRAHRDAFRKVTFYSPPEGGPVARTSVKFYLSLADGGVPFVRMEAMYMGNDWIFMERMDIMDGDSDLLTQPFDNARVDREPMSGAVYESYDMLAPGRDVIAKIAEAKTPKVRLSGRGGYAAVDPPQIKAMKSMAADVLVMREVLFTAVNGKTVGQ